RDFGLPTTAIARQSDRTNSRPSGPDRTADTHRPAGIGASRLSWPTASQTRTPPWPQVASRLPSGLIATPKTRPRWPRTVKLSWPLAVSQTLTQRWRVVAATCLPSGLKATDRAGSRVSSISPNADRVNMGGLSNPRYSRTTPSLDAMAKAGCDGGGVGTGL